MCFPTGLMFTSVIFPSVWTLLPCLIIPRPGSRRGAGGEVTSLVLSPVWHKWQTHLCAGAVDGIVLEQTGIWYTAAVPFPVLQNLNIIGVFGENAIKCLRAFLP